MWPHTMLRAVDATGPDKAIKQESNPLVYFVFATFIVILTLYCLNMILSVLVDNFKLSQRSQTLSSDVQEWVEMN